MYSGGHGFINVHYINVNYIKLYQCKIILDRQEELNDLLRNECQWGHLDEQRLKKLLAAGADVNDNKTWSGMTCLQISASKGNYEIAKFLIKNNASVKMKDPLGGKTALHFASARGRLDVARLLLKKGADPNIKDKDGDSPLFLASLNGHTEIENILLEHGVSPLNDNEHKKKEKMIQERLNENLISYCFPCVQNISRPTAHYQSCKISRSSLIFIQFSKLREYQVKHF